MCDGIAATPQGIIAILVQDYRRQRCSCLHGTFAGRILGYMLKPRVGPPFLNRVGSAAEVAEHHFETRFFAR